jgi:hypothetical protein
MQTYVKHKYRIQSMSDICLQTYQVEGTNVETTLDLGEDEGRMREEARTMKSSGRDITLEVCLSS